MSTPDDPEHDPSLDPRRFGTWLRRCREQLGITRKDFAPLANMSQLGLRDIEILRYRATAAQRRRLIAAIAAVDPELAKTAPAEAA